MENGHCWCGREYPCLEHGSCNHLHSFDLMAMQFDRCQVPECMVTYEEYLVQL